MSETYDHVPKWCRPGAEVAEIRIHTGSTTAMPVTIAKVHKRYVTAMPPGGVVEDRYKIRTRADGSFFELLREAGGTWSSTCRLAPLDHPDVQALMASQRRRNLAAKVEGLANHWRQHDDTEVARDIAELLVKAGVIASYQLPENEKAE